MNALSDPALEAARLGVEKSLAIFATNQATLFTFDGKPIHSPELQQSELARLLVGVEASVEKAVAVADRVSAEVEAARLAPFSDPTSALSAADLAERLRAVAAGGSKSSRWLHWRYSKARLDREFAKSSQDPALSVFAATCRELGVVGEKSGLSSEAVKRQEAAAALKRWAGRELSIARDPEKDKADRAKSAAATRAMF